MKLRTSSKRKPTENLLLSRGQALTNKRPKKFRAVQQEGYGLRSTTAEAQQPQRLARAADCGLLGRNVPPVPALRSASLKQRGRLRWLAQHWKHEKVSHEQASLKPKLLAIQPARKSLRIRAKDEQKKATGTLTTRRGNRRSALPFAGLLESIGGAHERGESLVPFLV